MAKENTERSDEITDPNNPPRVLLRPGARRAALWSYLGPVIALFVIVGVAMIYWMNRGPSASDVRVDEAAVGTVGRDSPGGGDPNPAFKSPDDELKYRGSLDSNENALRTIDRARAADGSSPQRVLLEAVAVEKVEGQVTWVKKGTDQIAVVSDRSPEVKAGDVVSVSGMTERDATGDVRIRGDIHKN
jgi:hypothetical protein